MQTNLRLEDIILPDNLLRDGTPEVEDLAASIAEVGILQPLLVRHMPDGRYLLVAGKRRYTAAQQAGLEQVPVVIRDDLDDRRARIAELSENLARRDMTPHQEAKGILELVSYQFAEQGMEVPLDEVKRMLYRLSNEVTGKVKEDTLRSGVEGEVILRTFDIVGRSFPAFVTGVLPALSWPKDVQEAMEGGLGRTAARALAGIKDEHLREQALRRVQNGEKAGDVKRELLSGAAEDKELESDLSAAEQLEEFKKENGWLVAPPALDSAEATRLAVIPREGLAEELVGRFRGKRYSLHALKCEDALSLLRLGVSVWSSNPDERFAGEHLSAELNSNLIVLGGDNVGSLLRRFYRVDGPLPRIACLTSLEDLYLVYRAAPTPPEATFLTAEAKGPAGRDIKVLAVFPKREQAAEAADSNSNPLF